jgi:O-antigen ligase
VWVFVVSIAVGLAVTTNVYLGSTHPLRFSGILIVLVLMHLVACRRIWLSRETILYAIFASYSVLSLIWTSDTDLGLGNMNLTINFLLTFVLFSSLVYYNSVRVVVTGVLLGFMGGALGYTLLSRFPFAFPEEFSYNAIAGMYLFGLFVTALCGWCLRRHVIATLISLILVLLIAATTSIKTNLGVMLGTIAGGVMYIRFSLRAFLRYSLPVAAFLGLIAYGVSSNGPLMERVEAGLARVSIGANLLLSREEDVGNIGLDQRKQWQDEGIQGWIANPIYGEGVEAFRAEFGITSHSTPVDLLYNTGLIGFSLFYALFVSIAWRVIGKRNGRGSPRGLVLAALACYAFISLSGTMYYDVNLAAVFAMSAALLCRADRQAVMSTEISRSAIVNPHEKFT